MSEEKKNEILQEKLDTEELEAVSGGGGYTQDTYSYDKVVGAPKIDKHGGCTGNYYKQKCSATVENDSHCWSDDKCTFLSEKYTKIS